MLEILLFLPDLSLFLYFGWFGFRRIYNVPTLLAILCGLACYRFVQIKKIKFNPK
jgi:hypothetical protein